MKLLLAILLLLLAGCSSKETIIDQEPIENNMTIKQENVINEEKNEETKDNIEIIINPDIIEEVIIDTSIDEEKQDDKTKGFKIIYTSDMHGNLNGRISYANLKSYKKKMIDEGYKTVLIDNGDIICGSKAGKYNDGSDIINIMNKTGYDYITIGNHDYVYGYERLLKLNDEGKFKILSANLIAKADNEPIFAPYDIIESDGKSIAIIGISYPNLGDYRSKYKKDGEYLLEVLNKDQLYNAIQNIIDEIKDKVDCIIVMGHCSGTENDTDTVAYKIIKNTSGIDIFLSGHSHRIVENRIIRDKDGNEVIFSIPGASGNCFGVATIDDNCIKTEIITEYEEKDEKILALQNSLLEAVK